MAGKVRYSKMVSPGKTGYETYILPLVYIVSFLNCLITVILKLFGFRKLYSLKIIEDPKEFFYMGYIYLYLLC